MATASKNEITAFNEIRNEILKMKPDKKQLEVIKREVVTKYNLDRFPRNSEIFELASENEKNELRPYLQVRNVRSISGVNVISVMTAPFACRHGACIFCPGGPTWGTPMSYTGREPASMRAIQNGFDPVMQLQSRIDQLEKTGHNAEKLDIIIMGGTFNSNPREYQDAFMLGVYEALNGQNAESIQKAKELNQNAKYRCVGLTFETKPDWAKKNDIIHMLEYGVTRVEIGVQTLRDEVLSIVNRGHTVQNTADSFKAMRDAGLKITAHMMPGLPGTTPKMDIEDFHTLYYDPQFIPDEIKIYPTQVMENTPLAKMAIEGEYKPLTNEETFDIMLEAKKITPPFVRIKRALRDLPIPLVVAGPTWGDMRDRIQKQMLEAEQICRCIRCREIGHHLYKRNYQPNPDDFKLKIHTYEAGEGIEHFLSYEDHNNVLIGFLRLRYPSSDVFIDNLKNSAIVRELHVYGTSLSIGDRDLSSFQHRGFGAKLLKEAENMSRDAGYKKIAIISGVGVREYYRKFGYRLDGYYMSKEFE
jgi:elongator complex protein 3